VLDKIGVTTSRSIKKYTIYIHTHDVVVLCEWSTYSPLFIAN